MQAQRINITLPVDLLRDLRRSIPERSRSKFIAKAVKDKLSRKKLKLSFKKSLKVNAEFYKQEIKQIQEDFKYADAEILERLP